jgi:signal transduction histidine kinase
LLALSRINVDLALRDISAAAGKESLHALNTLLADALDVTRKLTAELGPAILYRGDLVMALRWLGRWFDAQYHLGVDVTGAESMETEEEIRVALFRASRELLFNIVKHAHVTSARIDVSRSADGRVQVVVRDDGVGFDPESVLAGDGADQSFGLLSVRDHLELLGGRLDIDSAPGCGTSIRLLGPAPRTPGTESAAPATRAGGQPKAGSRGRPGRPRRAARSRGRAV